MRSPSQPAKPPRPSSPPSSRPVAREFVALMRGLWVQHDPMRFLDAGGETFDSYEHQAYVTALCADEIRTPSDAAKVILAILRHEFGYHSPTWADAEFTRRMGALSVDLFEALRQRPEHASEAASGVYPTVKPPR